MRRIAQGAEAVLTKDENKIIKERIKKGYRIREIDENLRKFRTKREAKVIEKLVGVSPELTKIDEENYKIEMEFVEGKLLRDYLDEKNYEKICNKIGENVALVHDKNIIHGDLTTSNMILKNDTRRNSKGISCVPEMQGISGKIYFIDFGLSFFSHKIEDKAVDLHLLKQALESKHYKFWDRAFNAVLEGYKKSENSVEVIKRLEQVEKRGRYKQKRRVNKKIDRSDF